jgi:hypothetical protein
VSDWTRKLPALADLAVGERSSEDEPPACDGDPDMAGSLREGFARLETIFAKRAAAWPGARPRVARGEGPREALFAQLPAQASLRQRLRQGGTPDQRDEDGAPD